MYFIKPHNDRFWYVTSPMGPDGSVIAATSRTMFRVLSLVIVSHLAYADVGVIMNESTGKGISGLTSAGHSAVYLSDICAETPTRLRLCRPGEQGSVLSNYTNFGENRNYEWNIAPLNYFLYGVDSQDKAPLYGNAAMARVLQDAYREKYLQSVCPETPCGDADKGVHWRDMVGGTFMRDIYLFRVKSTQAQDEALIAEFNSLPNVNHYNGFLNNCADFARSVVNRYFPGAARADHLNDFGMTSPKAISKSFTNYGKSHPELEFSAERFPQLPGPIRRSSENRKGTEVGFRSKKWFIPLALVYPHELVAFVAAYTLTGRFNADREVERHSGEPGTDAEWRQYRSQFREILDGAVKDGVFANHGEVKTYFKQLDRSATPLLDESGAPELRVDGRTVGLSAANITGSGSDSLLGYRIMLARVYAVLRTPEKQRESFSQFQQDWRLLTALRDRI